MSQHISILGEKLRLHRESLGLRVEDLAREICISPVFVRALEEGRLYKLPAKVYAAGIIKQIAMRFPPEGGARVWTADLNREWQEAKKNQNPAASLSRKDYYGFYITPMRLAAITAALGFLFFIVFMGWQIKAFISTPHLRVEEPHEGALSHSRRMTLRGTAEKESQLTINGRELILQSDGAFDVQIELISGLNTLEFIVQNRFGKITREARNVVVQ